MKLSLIKNAFYLQSGIFLEHIQFHRTLQRIQKKKCDCIKREHETAVKLRIDSAKDVLKIKENHPWRYPSWALQILHAFPPEIKKIHYSLWKGKNRKKGQHQKCWMNGWGSFEGNKKPIYSCKLRGGYILTKFFYCSTCVVFVSIIGQDYSLIFFLLVIIIIYVMSLITPVNASADYVTSPHQSWN